MRNIRTLDSPTLLGLLAILLWSSVVALARRVSEQMGPFATGASVYLMASLFLASIHLARGRSFRTFLQLPPRYVFGAGFFFVAYTIPIYVALGLASSRSQTMEIGLLNYLWPAFTILFSLPILGNRAKLELIPGTLLALLGVVWVLTGGALTSWDSLYSHLLDNPLAYSLAFFAAVSWGLYSNVARLWGGDSAEGGVPLFTLASGAAFALIAVLRPESGTLHLGALPEVVVLASFTALGYLFWDIAMRKGEALLVAACSYLTPFFSTVVSTLYLGVRPGLSLWLGCALIIIGSVWSWRSVRAGDE
jgi:drug/metabolite transporter (DMT)-like permease